MKKTGSQKSRVRVPLTLFLEGKRAKKMLRRWEKLLIDTTYSKIHLARQHLFYVFLWSNKIMMPCFALIRCFACIYHGHLCMESLGLRRTRQLSILCKHFESYNKQQEF